MVLGIGFGLVFGGIAGGIVSSIQWLLRLATSYTADTGTGAVNSSTAQKVVEAFDATTGLKLVTVPDVSLTAPVPGLRLSYDTDEGAIGVTQIAAEANRDFTSDTGFWDKTDASVTIPGNGTLVFNSTTNARGVQNLGPRSAGIYKITLAVDSISGSLRAMVNGSNVSTVGTHIEYIAVTENERLKLLSISSASAVVSFFDVEFIRPLFVNNDGSGNSLHPLNAAGEMKLIPWRLDSEPYLLGDEIVTSVGVHNHFYVCTTAGTTAASAPTYTASGVQPLDGSAVFTYTGRYSNLATSTVNHVPAVLTEPVATQQLLNSTAPATQTTGSLPIGDYVLWQNGTGSSDITAGTATISTTGSATDGSPLTFTVSGAGTVTVTITGGPPDEFQLEGGSIPSSFITTAGATVTRPADALTSAQLITAERLALRYTGNGTSRTLLSDGTRNLSVNATGKAEFVTGVPDGVEVITNGDFSSEVGWLATGPWSITGGQAVVSPLAVSGYLRHAIQAGVLYQIEFDIISRSAGSVSFFLAHWSTGASFYAVGHHVFQAVNLAGEYWMYAPAFADLVIDNVSIQEIHTLTSTATLDYGDTIALRMDETAEMYVAGSLEDSVTLPVPIGDWDAITVLDSISDIKADSTIDLTDIIGD